MRVSLEHLHFCQAGSNVYMNIQLNFVIPSRRLETLLILFFYSPILSMQSRFHILEFPGDKEFENFKVSSHSVPHWQNNTVLETWTFGSISKKIKRYCLLPWRSKNVSCFHIDLRSESWNLPPYLQGYCISDKGPV